MPTVRAAPRVDRVIVVAVLFAVVAMAWAYLFVLAAAMGEMGSSLAMPMTSIEVTFDVYGHLFPSSTENLVGGLDRLYRAAQSG